MSKHFHTTGRVVGTSMALLLGSTIAASAANFTVESITGIFENSLYEYTKGGALMVEDGVTAFGDGSSVIQWGAGGSTNSGIPAANQSSYTFDGAAPPAFDPVTSPFVIGTLTHDNRPIFRPWLTSTELATTIEITFYGKSFTIDPRFFISHEETPNQPPCPDGSVTVCDDIVSLTSIVADEYKLTHKGHILTLTLSGFEVNGMISDSFLTAEGGTTPGHLVASFNIAPIPLPAAGWLLLGGLGALGAAAARRRRKTTDA